MVNYKIKLLGIAGLVALSGCTNSYKRASALSELPLNIKNQNQTWFSEYEKIYLGGWSETFNNRGLHYLFANEACDSINNDQLLQSMHENKLIINLPNCLVFDNDKPQDDGLLIKFTDDYYFISQDHFFVEFIGLSDKHLYDRVDYAMVPIPDYTSLWIINYRLRLIFSSKMSYGNDEEWNLKMSAICTDISDESYCSDMLI
jgi:hypothetical protein